MNGLKTIFSRITTMDGAIGALQSVNVSIKDMGGNVKPVSNILGELAGKWTSLSDEQRQNIGVSVAGRYQLTRFLALMNNFSIATDATKTALNSQGSSMREQAKYADSLEARINRLDTAWNKLVLSAGGAVLTDGLIGAIETLNDLATGAAFLVDKIGLLSGVFATAGVSVLLLSTKFRAFSTALIFGTQSMSATALASTGLSAGMTRASIATIGMTTALRGLMSATIVGVAFAAIGFAVEKLIGAYSEAKQKQEDFEQSQQKNIDALTTNKSKTEELLASYKSLSAQRGNSPFSDVTKEKEYLKISSQIAEIYPALIGDIDATGQAHLKSSEQIDKEIKLTNDLIQAKKDQLKVDAEKTIQKQLDENNKLQKQIKDMKYEQEGWKSKPMFDFNKDEYASQAARLETEIKSAQIKISGSTQKIIDQVLKVSEAYNKLEINPAIGKSVTDFVSSLDMSKLDASTLQGFSIELAKLTDNMQKAYSSGDKSGFDAASNSIRNLAQGIGATDVQLSNFSPSLDKVKTSSDLLAKATHESNDAIDGTGQSADQATNAYASYNEELQKSLNIENQKASAAELLAGVTQSQIDKIYEQISVYELLSKQQNLDAQQKDLLTNATNYLKAATIAGVEGKKINIKAVQEEVRANDIYLKAMEYASKGQLTAQQMQTLNAATGAKTRIQLFNEEIAALIKINEAYADSAKQTADIAASSGDEEMTIQAEKMYRRYMVKRDNIQKYRTDGLAKIVPNFIDYTNQIGKQIGYQERNTVATDKATKATDKANKATEQSVYITDKFRKAQEKLNLELAKQQSRRERYAKTSKEYQDSLKKEIALLEQQQKLYENQTKILNAQIKSGHVQQKGVVNASEAKYSTSTSRNPTGGTAKANSKVKGYQGTISKYANQYGVSSYVQLLMAKMMQESHGSGGDPMQSSESLGLRRNAIKSPTKSIQQGVKYFSQMLKKAGGDIKLALQSYNCAKRS